MEKYMNQWRSSGTGKKILFGILSTMVILVVLMLLFALICIIRAPSLDLEDVSPNEYFTTVLDEEGGEIQKLQGGESNRIYVSLEQIPDDLERAVIAIEDERFYHHHGVDVRGIVRALTKNISSFSASQGASTITQQLVKNNLLTGWTQEKTIFDKIQRKIQEQYLALRLEHKVTKQWILENYLNSINMGNGCWGVETAAKGYYGKDVSELSLSECAVLAAVIQSPTNRNPLTNPENNRNRYQYVLSNMVEQGFITQEQCNAALADDVYSRISANATTSQMDVLSYYEDALVNQVATDLQKNLGYSEQDAWLYLYRGGLTIRSTQNSSLQKIAEEEVNRDSWYGEGVQAAAVVMEPSTGEVKALVGGRGEKTASLVMNRATSSLRQPGSTIKVIGEYAAALDTGKATLGTVYDNAPMTYSNGTALKNADGSYSGRTTVRDAIVHSYNICAVRCIQSVGVDTTWNYLKSFGLNHLTENDKVEALALGGIAGGVTPLEMTAAYNAIANGGVYLSPIYYTEVLDRNGNVIMKPKQENRRVIQKSTAELLRSAMEDVITRGTGTPAQFSGTEIAGKSGTTDSSRDLWFVGFSPSLCCGIWGGYDNNAPQGSSGYVKSIWRAIMSRGQTGSTSFESASDLKRYTICTKCGKLAVSGTCDHTVQGDMTREEYFAPSSVPTEMCDCHVKVTICKESGQPAGSYCIHTEQQAYLVSGTAGTADADAVKPASIGTGTCPIHTNFWDILKPKDSEKDNDDKDNRKNNWGFGWLDDFW